MKSVDLDENGTIDYNEFLNFCLELKRIENETVMLKRTDRLKEQR